MVAFSCLQQVQRTQLLHLKFTQPGKVILVLPCSYAWLCENVGSVSGAFDTASSFVRSPRRRRRPPRNQDLTSSARRRSGPTAKRRKGREIARARDHIDRWGTNQEQRQETTTLMLNL